MDSGTTTTLYFAHSFYRWSAVKVGKYEQPLTQGRNEVSVGFIPVYRSIDDVRKDYPGISDECIGALTIEGELYPANAASREDARGQVEVTP